MERDVRELLQYRLHEPFIAQTTAVEEPHEESVARDVGLLLDDQLLQGGVALLPGSRALSQDGQVSDPVGP